MNQDDQSIKYIALYGLLYFSFFTIIATIASIFRTLFFYTTASFIVAAFTATSFVKHNGRPLTSSEKKRITSGTFICTVAVNFLFAVGDVRSTDNLGACFIARQLIELLGLSMIFGTNYIYDSMKKSQ